MLRLTSKFPKKRISISRYGITTQFRTIKYNSGPKSGQFDEKIEKREVHQPLDPINDPNFKAVKPPVEYIPPDFTNRPNEFTGNVYSSVAIIAGASLIALGTLYWFSDVWDPIGLRRLSSKFKDDPFNEINSPKKQKNKKGNMSWIQIPSNDNDESVPGVYVWGHNLHHVIDSPLEIVKAPTRLAWFDGKLLKDLIISEDFGVALLENGNLVQWGDGYKPSDTPIIKNTTTAIENKLLSGKGKTLNVVQVEPEVTVEGLNFEHIVTSNEAIYALDNKKELYTIPISKDKQENLAVSNKSPNSWLGRKQKINYTKINLSLLNNNEVITDMKAGKEHLLLLTSNGRVFTTATGFETLEKSHGQFGIPTFSQFDDPPEPNTIHEVFLLNNNKLKDQGNGKVYYSPRRIMEITTGDYHSLARDEVGRLWSFGKNTFGQLGIPFTYENEIISFPQQVPLRKILPRKFYPSVEMIAAGGETSFIKLIPLDVQSLLYDQRNSQSKLQISNALSFDEDDNENESSKDRDLLQVEPDYKLSFGTGLVGQLGTGRYIHSQSQPLKIRDLMNQTEFNDKTNQNQSIPIHSWSVGNNHVAVTMNNANHKEFGRDVFLWGGNQYGQLGNGKRNHIPKPFTPPTLPDPQLLKQRRNQQDRIGLDEYEKRFGKEGNEVNTAMEYNNRLQLFASKKLEWKDEESKKTRKEVIDQVIVTGDNTTGLYYKKS